MRVALISPFMPPTAMNFQFSMELIDCSYSHIPLNLLTIGALTPAQVDVILVDENVEEVDLDMNVDVVALTGTYTQRRRMFELAGAFRARGKLVAFGGPVVIDCFEESRAQADVLFVGEAELTWPRFCADYAKGDHQKIYRQEEPVDMALSPIPRFELLKPGRYSSGCVQATRGCRYHCEFCDVPVKFGTIPRSKPVAQVVEEVRRLAALGFDSVFIVDDNFLAVRVYAKELLIALAELVAELPTPMYFYTQVPLNVAADDELLELFHRASFRRFFLGIETFDGDKLAAMDKEHNSELDVYEAVRKIQEHGITVWAGIIVGLDDDDEQTFEDQYQFISRSGITPTLVGLLQAQPGTPLYERVEREGRLRKVADIVGSGAIGTLEAQALTNIRPTRLDEATQLSLTARFLRRVYAPEAVAERLILGVERSRKRSPPIFETISAAGLKAILKTTAYYVTHREPRMRKHVQRILTYLATHRLRGLDELIYHLVIYKHMYEYYHRAADLCDAAARQITTHEVYLRD
ncbi:MAG: radical SAM protein [bacterium]